MRETSGNPADLAGSLVSRVKNREAKKKMIDKKTEVEERLTDIVGMIDYLQSLDVNTESFSVSEFKKQAGFLQDIFRADFTPDIKQLIEEVPDVDEEQLIEAEKSLSGQADEMSISVYQMLEQFSQDEDQEIREHATVLKKYLEAKEKIAFIKTKLKDWMVAALKDMRVNAETEFGLSEDELKALEVEFGRIEVSKSDYSTYATEMARRFSERMAQQSGRLLEVQRQRKLINDAGVRTGGENGAGLTYYKSEYDAQPYTVRNQDDLLIAKEQGLYKAERMEADVKIDKCLWDNFFEFIQSSVESQFQDEAKRRNLLERIAGVTKPDLGILESGGVFYSGVVYNRELDSIFGEDVARKIVDKFLQTRCLTSLKGQEYPREKSDPFRSNKVVNSALITDYLLMSGQLSGQLQLGPRQSEKSQPNRFLSNFMGLRDSGNGTELEEKDLNKKIYGLIKDNPEFLNKVEAVIKARGWNEGYSSPFYVAEYEEGTFVDHKGISRSMPLQKRDGVFFESAEQFEKRAAEAKQFGQSLSDAVNSGRRTSEKVIITEQDAINVANNERQRAKDAVVVAKKGIQDQVAELARDRAAFESTRTAAEGAIADSEKAIQSLKRENGDLHDQLESAQRQIKEAMGYIKSLEAADFKHQETNAYYVELIRRITLAVNMAGFGNKGEVIKKIKDALEM